MSVPSGLTVQVNYTTTNGTALGGRDFYTDFGLLTFAPGVTNQTFTVQVIGDTVFETNEAFQVRLFNAANAFFLRSVGTATITDNGFVALESFKVGAHRLSAAGRRSVSCDGDGARWARRYFP